jgi:hypothetical protein
MTCEEGGYTVTETQTHIKTHCAMCGGCIDTHITGCVLECNMRDGFMIFCSNDCRLKYVHPKDEK